MISVRKVLLFFTATFIFCILFSKTALAITVHKSSRGGGAAGHLDGAISIGLGFAYTSTDQSDLNSAIDTANTSTAGGISTKNFSGSYELYAQWVYRFDRSSYAFMMRPSYVWQSTTGSGVDGSYNYKLSGYSVFPMLRVYPLENSFIHFYMQGGLGYGSLNGDITAGASSVQFKGSAFGAIGGIGVDFCITDVHCISVEGNLRYLPIERNLATGGNCSSSTNTIPGLSQCSSGNEVEKNYNDLQTTMSGVQGILGYTYNF